MLLAGTRDGSKDGSFLKTTHRPSLSRCSPERPRGTLTHRRTAAPSPDRQGWWLGLLFHSSIGSFAADSGGLSPSSADSGTGSTGRGRFHGAVLVVLLVVHVWACRGGSGLWDGARVPPSQHPMHLAAAASGYKSSPCPDLAIEATNPIKVSALGLEGGSSATLWSAASVQYIHGRGLGSNAGVGGPHGGSRGAHGRSTQWC